MKLQKNSIFLHLVKIQNKYDTFFLESYINDAENLISQRDLSLYTVLVCEQ